MGPAILALEMKTLDNNIEYKYYEYDGTQTQNKKKKANPPQKETEGDDRAVEQDVEGYG